jgi:hypothetical protein
MAVISLAASSNPSGLISAYGSDEGSGATLADISGNGITGQLQGATWTTAGKYSGGLSFNGSANYVDLGTRAVLQSTGSMSWSAWVYATGNPPDDGQIVALSDYSAGWQFKTTPDTGVRTFGIAISPSGAGHTQRYSKTVMALNTWYHVAAVYNATAKALDIYVNGTLDNGVLIGSIPAAQVVPNISATLGKREGGFFFKGTIDNVRIYSKALSAAEVQADMVTPVGGSGSGSAPTVSSLSCNQTSLSSGVGSMCTITLSQGAPTGGATVTLSDNSSLLTTPATAMVAAGSTSGTFTVTAGAIATDQAATVTATLNGASKTTTINLVSSPVSLSSVSCSPSAMTSGGSSTCTVALSKAAPLGGTVVTISKNASWLTVPTSMTVAAGAITGGFAAQAGTVTSTQSAIITAALSGQSVTAIVTAQPASTPKPAGLVSAFGFDEGAGTTASDTSGSGVKATLNGLVWTTGKFGGAVSANGTSSSAVLPAIDLSGTAAVTVSMWVNRTYSTSGGHMLFESSANFTASTTGFALFPDDSTCGGIMAGLRGNAGLSINCFRQPTSGVWHHLAAVFQKSSSGRNEVALYVDGVAQTPTRRYATANNTDKFGQNSLYLFSRAGTQQFTAGIIDEMRVYNRALSRSEIQTDMNAAVRTYAPASSPKMLSMMSSRSDDSEASTGPVPTLSLSCSPGVVIAGSSFRCELNGGSEPSPRTIRLATTTDQVKVPATITTGPDQARVTFQAITEPFARQQSVTIVATQGPTGVEETVLIQGTFDPVMVAPGTQMARVGAATLFEVAVMDPMGLPVEVAAARVPAGARFDVRTGRFEWTPGASELGRHEVTFTAVNSAKRSSTTRVVIEVDSGTPELNDSNKAICSPGGVGIVTGKWLTIPAEVTKIDVNGNDAPVLRASVNSVEFLCPTFDPGTRLSIRVQAGGASSAAKVSVMEAVLPRILAMQPTGTEELLETPESRIQAQPGDVLNLLISGLPEGQALASGISAFVGDAPADIESIQSDSFAPGTFLVQIRIPRSVALGDSIPVFVQVVHDGRLHKSGLSYMAIGSK